MSLAAAAPPSGLYEAAVAAGRAVSGWPCLGDMALLREDAQSKVRAATRARLRRAAGVRPCPAGLRAALSPGLAPRAVRELPAPTPPTAAPGQ